MTRRRDIVSILKKNGFVSKGGTNHEKFVKGNLTVKVGWHREIPD